MQVLKRRRLARLLVNLDVILLQETHGTDSDLLELHTLAPSHFFSAPSQAQKEVSLLALRNRCVYSLHHAKLYLLVLALLLKHKW